jgi:hypothetical protein
MADEEHIEVNLDDQKVDKTEKTEPEVEVVDKVEVEDDAPPKVEVSPDEGINELKRKFEREQAARAEAERRAAEIERAAQRAVQNANISERDANYQLVVNAIETVKGRADAIKTAYSSAMAAGDYDKAAELQEAMSINASQLVELQRGEREMRANLEAQVRQARQPVEPAPRSQEPIAEQLAKQVSPASAAWLRQNRDAISDERAVKRMFRAHEDAVDDGIEPDTPEYFNYIEGRLGIRASESEAPTSAPARAPAQETRRAPPPPPAPVSRGGSRPNVVRLSKTEAEMAKMMGMSETEYAKNKVALQREGKMGN